jgi:hypothetical protein
LELDGDGLELPESIRFCDSLAFFDNAGNGKPGPAVLAGMTDPIGDLTACHRIYLEPVKEGEEEAKPTKRKNTEAAKQMLGKPNGSAVRFPARDRSGRRAPSCCGWFAPAWPCQSFWRASSACGFSASPAAAA